MFRQLEASLETTVELLGEDAVTFVFITPILWAFQWIRCSQLSFLKLTTKHLFYKGLQYPNFQAAHLVAWYAGTSCTGGHQFS